MNIEFIEQKLNEINKELEKEVMSVLMDESLDRKQTNFTYEALNIDKKDSYQCLRQYQDGR
ncbi:MAG: hypothetical protein Q9M39_04230 [Sulfurovum sp.]|nr:hypothetical protein [Sulfurovum sp.]